MIMIVVAMVEDEEDDRWWAFCSHAVRCCGGDVVAGTIHKICP